MKDNVIERLDTDVEVERLVQALQGQEKGELNLR